MKKLSYLAMALLLGALPTSHSFAADDSPIESHASQDSSSELKRLQIQNEKLAKKLAKRDRKIKNLTAALQELEIDRNRWGD